MLDRLLELANVFHIVCDWLPAGRYFVEIVAVRSFLQNLDIFDRVGWTVSALTGLWTDLVVWLYCLRVLLPVHLLNECRCEWLDVARSWAMTVAATSTSCPAGKEQFVSIASKRLPYMMAAACLLPMVEVEAALRSWGRTWDCIVFNKISTKYSKEYFILILLHLLI